MALSEPFFWGKGGAKLTPEQIARQRAMEMELASGGIDTSPVGHWTQGLARVANAAAGAFRRGRLDGLQKDSDAYNSQVIANLLAGGSGDVPTTTSSTLPATDVSREVTATAPTSGQPMTNDIMTEFLAPIREEVKNPYALAAIASTGRAESGYDPQKMNARWSDPSQSGQQGMSGGLMSWRNDRLANLENYAKLAGEDPSNISAGTQGRFFLQEDPNLIAQLNKAQSVEEAQDLMNNAWRFAGYDGPSQERARRLSYAQEYLPTFQSTETASLDPSVGMPAAGDAANTEWLRYANNGATRNQPISGDLQKALSFLPEMGLSLEVFSGGQPGIDEGGARVGSTRHDHGGALDGFLHDTKTGRRLDWANPEDQPIFAEVVKRARANGVTGFGAGDGYMQPGSMHIGYGNPGVWGSGGKGANAAQWLRAAYEAPLDQPTGAQQAIASIMPEQETVLQPIVDPAGVQVADASGFVPGGTGQGEMMQRARAMRAQQPAQVQQQIAQELATGGQTSGQPVQTGSRTQQLFRMAADPMLDANSKKIVGLLLEQEMAKEQAAREYQQKRQLQQEGWDREDQRNAVLDRRYDQEQTYNRGKDERTFGLDRDRFEFDKGQAATTSDIKEYEYAKGQGYAGNFAQFQQEMRKASASNTNVNVGEGDKFYENLDKKNAETFALMSDTGMQARAKIAQIDRLEGLMANAPQGGIGALKQAAGEWGIATEGLSDIQAATAMLEKMVPEQRAPGTGPMSDADIKMFRSSLPRVLNQKGGNQLIFQTMRGIAQYEMQMGEIADQVADRAITPAEGRKLIRELKNPLADFKIPEGVTPNEGWKELSPGVKFKKKSD